MTIPTVFMFSGQGSQFFQMGRSLFDQNRCFRESMLRMDSMVRDLLSGQSVVETLYHSGRQKWATYDHTLSTHPAIFMVEYSLARALIEAGVEPNATLGVSLGTSAAAVVAGLVDVELALSTVVQQAISFETTCEPGGMLAVLADPKLFERDFVCQNSELAAVNSSSHFVLSAEHSRLGKVEAGLLREGVTFQRLPVSFAFHSRWIDKAKDSFQAFDSLAAGNEATLPMMCCEQAALVARLPAGFWWNVARRAIRFPEAIACMEQMGEFRYVDIGPSGTLATLLKYGLPRLSRSRAYAIMTPHGRDISNFDEVVSTARSGRTIPMVK